MPIGNLTSQIFANIYMNEFDRFVKHNLKPKAYLRYWDDFIMVEQDLPKLNFFRAQATHFLRKTLKFHFNPKSDKIFKVSHGLKFLGVVLFANGRILNKRNRRRITQRLNQQNAGSYFGFTRQHGNKKIMKQFQWLLLESFLAASQS